MMLKKLALVLILTSKPYELVKYQSQPFSQSSSKTQLCGIEARFLALNLPPYITTSNKSLPHQAFLPLRYQI